MIFLILLWIFAIILIIVNPQSKAIRLCGITWFFAGCGGLAYIILFQLIPLLDVNTAHSLIVAAKYTAGVLFAMSFYGGPYFLLVFSIHYSEVFNTKRKFLVNVFLLVPIIWMCAHTSIYPVFKISPIELLVWATPYVLVSVFLLIYNVFIAEDRKTRQSRFLVFLLIAPNSLGFFLINYLAPVMGVPEDLRQILDNTVSGTILFTFVVLAVRYGILGVRIEVLNIDQQMKAVTLGTNLINHSIKNEVAKIKICVANLASFVTPNQSASENMAIIEESFNHIAGMISRIQQKTGAIVLKEEPCRLTDMVKNVLRANGPLLQDRNIEILTKIDPGIFFFGDKLHFTEAISNILQNAVEAIPVSETGRIKVEAKVTKRQLILEFCDNGSGIAKDVLPNIFEPFFSTKHKPANFGLGLSYSLNVLQKSGGTLEAFSKENSGTTIVMKLPVSKVLRNYHPAATSASYPI